MARNKNIIRPLHRMVLSCTIALLIGIPSDLPAQDTGFRFTFQKAKKKRQSMQFDMVSNLIILPVKINNSDTLNFILDTGIRNTLVTGTEGLEGVRFAFGRKIEVRGLGHGDHLEAFHSYNNTIELPGVRQRNASVIVIMEGLDFLSQGLGKPIHGVLGADLFSSFIVEIDYQTLAMTLFDVGYFRDKIEKRRRKRGYVMPITVHNRRPYVTAEVFMDGAGRALNLLIDSGASHAFSLYSASLSSFAVPEQAHYDFLGVGLSGEIFGHVIRGDSASLGPYTLHKPIILFPEAGHAPYYPDMQGRNGSIGADVLRRYRIIFDYPDEKLILRPNRGFDRPFRYNYAGVEVIAPDPGIRRYMISRVMDGSAAERAGLQEGDVLLYINGMYTRAHSLGEVVNKFLGKPGKVLKIEVLRNGQKIFTKLTLADPL